MGLGSLRFRFFVVNSAALLIKDKIAAEEFRCKSTCISTSNINKLRAANPSGELILEKLNRKGYDYSMAKDHVRTPSSEEDQKKSHEDNIEALKHLGAHPSAQKPKKTYADKEDTRHQWAHSMWEEQIEFCENKETPSPQPAATEKSDAGPSWLGPLALFVVGYWIGRASARSSGVADK